MLDAVKLALGVTIDDYDSEIRDLIDAALLDLGIAGVVIPEPVTTEDGDGGETTVWDKLVLQAVKTYCRAHFRSPSDYDRLKASYDEQKAQLQIATGYTDWGEADGEG